MSAEELTVADGIIRAKGRTGRLKYIAAWTLVPAFLLVLAGHLALDRSYGSLSVAADAANRGDPELARSLALRDTALPARVRDYFSALLVSGGWDQRLRASESSHGGPAHPDAALQALYVQAAAAGSSTAQEQLLRAAAQGVWYAGSAKGTLRAFEQAADGGSETAAFGLAQIYGDKVLAARFELKPDAIQRQLWLGRVLVADRDDALAQDEIVSVFPLNVIALFTPGKDTARGLALAYAFEKP